jgi:multidrug/hemolysin transport system ATP-binding protein
MNNIIEVKNLEKRYGNIVAVDNINFNVKEGDLFAFLGPNGAGKSTVINILCTILKKNSGEVIIHNIKLDKEPAMIRNKIGVVFQNNILDDLLTVKENLILRGSLYGMKKEKLNQQLDFVLNYLEIKDISNRRFGNLSGGQKRRVEIARALLNKPKILFLDEPTTGLDPQTRIKVWEIIKKLQNEFKITVFLTTHYMEEAANADWVAIIDYGKIVVTGTPNFLKKEYSYDALRVNFKKQKEAIKKLITMNYSPTKIADMVQIPVKNSLEAFKLLKEMEGTFNDFEVIKGNMDDVFINIIGREIREDH